MIIGMTRKAKIAVTLPQELVLAARAAVREGRAASVSAYVAEAMAQRATADDLDALLAEMLDNTGGPMTDEERLWADQLLQRQPG
jgi:Arc/MetJ-type ribon-helix-helix transcriptional regulator